MDNLMDKLAENWKSVVGILGGTLLFVLLKPAILHILSEIFNKPVALLLLFPQQAGGVLRKSKYVSHLKAWNRRSKLRGILLR